MKRLLFSPDGRLSRAQFWTGVVIVIAAMIVVGLACVGLGLIIPSDPSPSGGYSVNGVKSVPFLLLIFGYIVFSVWAGIVLGIKRYHDRDKPGVWVLIQFVPIIGPFWYFIETGFLAGTPGPNTYGLDPLHRA